MAISISLEISVAHASFCYNTATAYNLAVTKEKPHENMSQPTNSTLSATYTSPTNEPFSASHAIPNPPSSSVADKAAYLGALRAAVTATQDTVNKELTERMEQDKARGTVAVAAAADEDKEEENYGEEVQGED